MGEREGQAAETRRQLHDAARQVFAEHGYRGATVALITKAAGTAHGTFYLYFKNKEDVFVEVIGDVTQEIYQHSLLPLSESQDERMRHPIRDRIGAFLEACQTNAPLFRALLEGVIVSPRVAEAWAEERQRMHHTVASLLDYLAERRIVRDMDTALMAEALCSMLEWYAFTGVGRTDAPTDLRTDDAVLDSLTAIWQRTLFPA